MAGKGAIDLAEFEAALRRRGGCAVGHVFNLLPDERADKLRAALDTPTIQHEAIATVLQSWGHQIAAMTVSRHRRGKCACD